MTWVVAELDLTEGDASLERALPPTECLIYSSEWDTIEEFEGTIMEATGAIQRCRLIRDGNVFGTIEIRTFSMLGLGKNIDFVMDDDGEIMPRGGWL